MHIVIFADFHDTAIGGVTTSIRGQRNGLEHLGHKVTIVCPPPTHPVVSDPAVIIVPSIPFFRPNGFPMVAPTKRNVRFIEKELKARGPIDIIHAQTNIGVGIMGAWIAKKLSVPLVQTMHGRDDVFAQQTYPIPPLTTRFILWQHKRYIAHTQPVPRLHDNQTAHNVWQVMVNHAQAADQVVVPSHHFFKKFTEHNVTKPIAVISNGISDEVIAKLPHIRRPVRTKNAPLKVIWCGRLSPEKRPIESIQAVMKIKDSTIDIYGSGPLEKTIREYIATSDLSHRVRLRGRVSQKDILKAMQGCDVLLYSSYGFDNQPMVLLEGVAAGIPIVYCDPDLTECMPDGGGLMTDGISIDAIAAALALLQDNPHQFQAMHKKMYDHRDKVVQSYHSKKMVTLYKHVIKRFKRP